MYGQKILICGTVCFAINRLIDEGYTPGEGNTATPANRTVHQIVETMSLNELSEKITEDYIKVLCGFDSLSFSP